MFKRSSSGLKETFLRIQRTVYPFWTFRERFSKNFSKPLFLRPSKRFVEKNCFTSFIFWEKIFWFLARSENYSQFLSKLHSACRERIWQTFSRNVFFSVSQQGFQTRFQLSGGAFWGKKYLMWKNISFFLLCFRCPKKYFLEKIYSFQLLHVFSVLSVFEQKMFCSLSKKTGNLVKTAFTRPQESFEDFEFFSVFQIFVQKFSLRLLTFSLKTVFLFVVFRFWVKLSDFRCTCICIVVKVAFNVSIKFFRGFLL